ncbi:EF-hand domain-containing protein [Novosphingobium olei]|uniref:Calcium-binding protein n=1 Tax=Novosphingobium olei TaxID=2728851 RepID=A0A7Y0BT26_9SPHN|nr:EF-hand domain-containing protein [Novosphingobium olei]NML96049.1 calcium-binding protein [Novosphingobium olei]
MTMKKYTLGLSAAAMLLGAGALYAAAPDGKARPMRADADGNGEVTWAEAKAKADEMWTKLDVNGDGKLDQADRDAKLAKKFDEIDTNHDGSISRDEFVAHHRAMKGPMDGPGRGEPGAPPPPTAGASGPMAGGPDGPMRGHRGMRGPGHGGPGGDMMGGPMVAMMADANKDGVVTRAEYDAAVKAHFDKVDTNHDGKITREERRAAFQAMRPRARDGEPMGGMGDMPPPPPGE